MAFEPGARAAWHTHPLGQILIKIFGLDWVQCEGAPIEETRPGDVGWLEPGEKHWHVASSTSAVQHIAFQEALEGKAVAWLGHVTSLCGMAPRPYVWEDVARGVNSVAG